MSSGCPTNIDHPCRKLTRQQHHSQQRREQNAGVTGPPVSGHHLTSSSTVKNRTHARLSEELFAVGNKLQIKDLARSSTVLNSPT